MKTLPALLCTLALAAPVFAAQNDTLVSFSTKGPDTYADGTTALDGESYALVWVKDGATFAGFLADGTVADPANSKCLVAVPRAIGGCCPLTVFQIDADYAATLEGGSYSVYLLDTRVADGENGYVVGGVKKAVNGYGAVATGIGDTAAQAGAVGVTAVADLPTDLPKPVIKDIKMVDGYVYVTVANTVPFLKYGLNESDGVEDAGAVYEAPQSGSDADLLFIAPATGDSGFFSIQGGRQLD